MTCRSNGYRLILIASGAIGGMLSFGGARRRERHPPAGAKPSAAAVPIAFASAACLDVARGDLDRTSHPPDLPGPSV